MIYHLGHDQLSTSGNNFINRKVYFQIWSNQFKKELINLYDDYLSLFDITKNIPPASYEEYVKLVFDLRPEMVENNLS